MRFEWDESKREANFRKHGLDLADAPLLFDGPLLSDHDDREEYGEERWIGIGMLHLRVLVVVYVERSGDTIRVISLRKATSPERRTYEDFLRHGLGSR